MISDYRSGRLLLTGSLTGSLSASPSSPNFSWPKKFKEALFELNLASLILIYSGDSNVQAIV